MKITIDRSKWRTGAEGPHRTGEGATELENDHGCMCCLGFVCSQADPNAEIRNVTTPSGMQTAVPGISECRFPATHVSSTQLTMAAMDINDTEGTTPETKEELLKELFANSPYELEFTGSYE